MLFISTYPNFPFSLLQVLIVDVLALCSLLAFAGHRGHEQSVVYRNVVAVGLARNVKELIHVVLVYIGQCHKQINLTKLVSFKVCTWYCLAVGLCSFGLISVGR